MIEDRPFEPLLLRKMSEIADRDTRALTAMETYGTVTCLCNKQKPANEFEIRRSSLVPYIDTVCQCCRAECAGLARLVCINCKEVHGCVTPHNCPGGFVVKAGGTYHLPHCPKCAPAKSEARIIERTVFDKMRGVT